MCTNILRQIYLFVYYVLVLQLKTKLICGKFNRRYTYLVGAKSKSDFFFGKVESNLKSGKYVSQKKYESFMFQANSSGPLEFV